MKNRLKRRDLDPCSQTKLLINDIVHSGYFHTLTASPDSSMGKGNKKRPGEEAGRVEPGNVLTGVKSFSSRGYKLLYLSFSRDNNNNYETAGAEESKRPFSR